MRIPWIRLCHQACASHRTGTCGTILVYGALLCSLLAGTPVRAQESEIEGQSVAEIRIVDDTGNALPGPTPSLPLEVGQPFDFAAERERLRVVFRNGAFADI